MHSRPVRALTSGDECDVYFLLARRLAPRYHYPVAKKLTAQQVTAWIRAEGLSVFKYGNARTPMVHGLAARKMNGCIAVFTHGATSEALVTIAKRALAEGYRVANNRKQELTEPTVADMFGCILIKAC